MEKIITNQVVCSSDRNLKENIQELPLSDPKIISKIKSVGIKSFNFKDDELKNKMYGVIAQEVQDAGLGELVYEKEDKTLAVDYTSLMILKILFLENELKLAVATNRYTQDHLEELTKRVEELERKNKELENK